MQAAQKRRIQISILTNIYLTNMHKNAPLSSQFKKRMSLTLNLLLLRQLRKQRSLFFNKNKEGLHLKILPIDSTRLLNKSLKFKSENLLKS